MVAFNCYVAHARQDNGYSLASHPHPPQFILEVASRATGIVDYTEKRADCARYGVAEYWRFAPTGGRLPRPRARRRHPGRPPLPAHPDSLVWPHTRPRLQPGPVPIRLLGLRTSSLGRLETAAAST